MTTWNAIDAPDSGDDVVDADDDWGVDPAPVDLEPASGEESEDEAEPTLYYGSVNEFVREFLRHAYKRPVNGRTRVWAADWWHYDEAVCRLEALWRAWEHLRLDPSTGMSVWWRDHADHHMRELFDPDAAFAAADATAPANQCQRGDPLPHEEPPADLFPDVREEAS